VLAADLGGGVADFGRPDDDAGVDDASGELAAVPDAAPAPAPPAADADPGALGGVDPVVP
jgi:hypothetical protein